MPTVSWVGPFSSAHAGAQLREFIDAIFDPESPAAPTNCRRGDVGRCPPMERAKGRVRRHDDCRGSSRPRQNHVSASEMDSLTSFFLPCRPAARDRARWPASPRHVAALSAFAVSRETPPPLPRTFSRSPRTWLDQPAILHRALVRGDIRPSTRWPEEVQPFSTSPLHAIQRTGGANPFFPAVDVLRYSKPADGRGDQSRSSVPTAGTKSGHLLRPPCEVETPACVGE